MNPQKTNSRGITAIHPYMLLYAHAAPRKRRPRRIIEQAVKSDFKSWHRLALPAALLLRRTGCPNRIWSANEADFDFWQAKKHWRFLNNLFWPADRPHAAPVLIAGGCCSFSAWHLLQSDCSALFRDYGTIGMGVDNIAEATYHHIHPPKHNAKTIL